MNRSPANKQVLVTGGAGYIGSHTCKALAHAGYQPVTYDDLSGGRRDAVKWGPFEHGDIRDAERLSAVLEKYAPMAAMHFAGLIEVGESVTDPAKFYDVNVGGTLRVLQAMQSNDVSDFIFSSTAAVYGTPEKVPIPEDAPARPINPYGSSKLMVENMLRDFDRAYGLKSVALRYFNAAGADPDGEIGEDHDPETHLIPLALRAQIGGQPLKLFGTDYATPDGTAVRDYIHVSDVATAHVKALDYLRSGGETRALNIGTGKGHSVRSILSVIERVTGHPVPMEEAARRPGDPPELVADPSLSRQILSLPDGSLKDLDTMVETAWRWAKKRPNPPLAGGL